MYHSRDTIPSDAFDDDATVTVAATGDVVPAFSISARGVPPLEAAISNGEIELVNGEEFTFTWTPADPTSRVRLTVNANNHGHAAPWEAVIECDTEDTGQVTVPAAMIDAFPETYRWEVCEGSDCPLSWLTRYHKTVTDVGGAPVRLDVGSRFYFYVIHEL
jgi:hypothetical protein